ncbi:MAG TPA: alpha/beta hydrolase [Kineosporiaceae bacterium]
MSSPVVRPAASPRAGRPRPVRVTEEVYGALGYLVGRLLFLNSRYAPQVHWGDIAHALDGFPTDDLDLSSAAFWNEWRLRWTAQADRYRLLADDSGTPAGRSRALRSAAACYHWAEFMDFEDPQRKLAARQRIRECFLDSLPGTDLDLVAGQLPATPDRAAVPYWVLLPPQRVRPAGPLATVVLSNGLDSMTEVEVLALAEPFLERGLAAVLFDGPGQGIQAGQTPLLVAMESVVADLVVRVTENPLLDQHRMAFLGISFGGYVALRVAATSGTTFRVVVNHGGGPQISEFAGLPRRLKEDFRFAFLAPAEADLQPQFDAMALTPDGPAPQTEVVSLHGALDDIFPVEALRDLHRAWGPRHTLEIHEREAHTSLNIINALTLRTADLVSDRLATPITP